MNRFIKNIVIISIGTLIVLFLLDMLYTKIYNNAYPRNKTQHILNLKKGEKLDYVFLGSSRVENTVMPSIIEDITGKSTINLGTQGAKLDDINIFLRLLISREVEIERLFVQVDYVYNNETSSDIVRSQSLPFIKSNSIIKHYLKRVDSNYNKNYYIPFYRYATNDYRLGFREFFATTVKKKSAIDFKDGFVPVYGSIEDSDIVSLGLPTKILDKNKSLVEIDSLCKANNIKVTYFCAPFCSKLETNNYLSKLKSKLPNFEDFSAVIKEDSLFNNCSHLNEKGALKFTKYLVEKLNL